MVASTDRHFAGDPAMSSIHGATEYLRDFRDRAEAIAEACTRCGACFQACPMVAPAGLGEADAEATTAGIVDLITGGSGTAEAVRWASVCSGSGKCIPACPEAIDTRFMVQLARGFARQQAGEAALNTRWRQGFQTMSRGVRILSRLQLPLETLARVRGQSGTRRERSPDVVFYTGCNILKTPHIALLCLDVLDLLGVDYEVMGGPGQCCGVYQFREGDFDNTARLLRDDRRPRDGRDLDCALLVPKLPGPDRRGELAELRGAVRQPPIRFEPVPCLPRRACRDPRRDDETAGR